jgi:CBS domain-containing protein
VNIEDVCRPQIATCPPTAILHDVAQRMERGDTGLVAVVGEGRRLQAVITERDLVRALAWDTNPHAATVMSYANTDVVTAALDEDSSVVARRMIEADVHRLPVVTAAGELIGVVSMRDLFAVETLMTPAGRGGS